MVSLCLALVSCTSLAAPALQNPPHAEVDLVAYLQHEDARLRQSAVILLADAVLSVRTPHSGDPWVSLPERQLYEMNSRELPTLFQYLRDYWKRPIPNIFVHWSVRPGSRYEQYLRFWRVLKNLKNIDPFPFESYIHPDEEFITRVSLCGMALVYSEEYKSKLDGFAKGTEPMRTYALEALGWAGRKDR
jgi:hypothetical protein